MVMQKAYHFEPSYNTLANRLGFFSKGERSSGCYREGNRVIRFAFLCFMGEDVLKLVRMTLAALCG